ncbi:MAG: hypothetical protein ACLR7D_14865 [Lachnospira eligens]
MAASQAKHQESQAQQGQHVINDLSGRIDMIIQDDTVDIGVESTIIDLSEESTDYIKTCAILHRLCLRKLLEKTIIDPAISGKP